MAKVTFAARPVAWVEVWGEARPRQGCPVPEDGGLVGRLLLWLNHARIRPVSGTVDFGPGCFRGAFEAADAEKVTAWLGGQGCARGAEAPWPAGASV
jgi:hypothetical protein